MMSTDGAIVNTASLIYLFVGQSNRLIIFGMKQGVNLGQCQVHQQNSVDLIQVFPFLWIIGNFVSKIESYEFDWADWCLVSGVFLK